MKKNNSKIDKFLSNEKLTLKQRFFNVMRSEQTYHLKQHLLKKYAFWRQPKFHYFMKHQFPMVAFTTVSTYIVYLMYKRHYEIVEKVSSNKSVQKETAEKEQELLAKILEDPTNKYYNKKIQEIKRNKKYQFEKFEKIQLKFQINKFY